MCVPTDVGAHEGEQGHAVAREAVIACGHAAKRFEPIQDALPKVAVLIQRAMIVSQADAGAVAARQDHRLSARGWMYLTSASA